MKDRKYKHWLMDYEYKDTNGLNRYSLTWSQIRRIIQEELEWQEKNGLIKRVGFTPSTKAKKYVIKTNSEHDTD